MEDLSLESLMEFVMNNFIEQLRSHRSIRKYMNKEVCDDVLDVILEAAICASTSGNMQAYSIIVSRDKTIKEQMFNAHFEQTMLMESPVFLTFCADFNRKRKWLSQNSAANNFDNYMSFMIASIDAILASQNAALAAESLGLGICYMGTTLASASEIGKVLDLPENVVPIVGFSLGYPDEEPVLKKRLPLKGVVHYEKYSDYSPEAIDEIYAEKNFEGMKRFKNDPKFTKQLEEFDIENLAQVYTQLKYTEKSHLEYSKNLLEYLCEQNFLKLNGV